MKSTIVAALFTGILLGFILSVFGGKIHYKTALYNCRIEDNVYRCSLQPIIEEDTK